MEDCISGLENNTVARINKDVVNHYLAKVYLTRAWDLNNQNDFTTAKSYAQKVFNSRGEVSLTYEELWNPNNENNSEILFAVQYDASSIASTTSGNNQQALFGPYLGGPETNQKLMVTQIIPAWCLHKWYAENDARYDASFMLTIYENYFDFYDIADLSTLKIRAYYPRVWERDYTNDDLLEWKQTHDTFDAFNFYPFIEDEDAYVEDFQQDFYTPTLRKFDCPSTRLNGSVNSYSSVRDIVLARLAETYFLYAEACIGLNDYSTAEAYVQKVLDRPGNAKTESLENALSGVSSQNEALKLISSKQEKN